MHIKRDKITNNSDTELVVYLFDVVSNEQNINSADTKLS